MTSARIRKKLRKDLDTAHAQAEPMILVRMKQNIDGAVLEELGIDCDPDYFDPRGQTGEMEVEKFRDNFVTVHFVQEVSGRPRPREFRYEMPENFIERLIPRNPTPL